MRVSFTRKQIEEIVQPKGARGATGVPITGIAALGAAAAGDLSFLGKAKYRAEVAGTKASVVLLPPDYVGEPQPDQLYLIVDNPSVALARLCGRIEQLLWPKPRPGIHPTALVDPSSKIAASATIGPQCLIEADVVIGERTHVQAQVFVGRGARLGDDCWLMPGVILAAECVLQNRVRLQPGVVVGSDGFGYEFVAGRHEKVPQVGNVVIHDDVEVGANTTIDRARFSQTVIGAGTKIDNLVQIAHNVSIGQHVILCAQVGVSGSSIIKDYAVLGGQAGIGGHNTVGRAAKIGGQSAVAGNVPDGAYVNGSPAISYMLGQRLEVLHRKLPELFKRVEKLENLADGA